MFVYSNEGVAEAKRLSASRLSDYEVARRTGVSRNTVMRWRRMGFPERAARVHAWTLIPDAYAYTLGLYLGDGCLVRAGRSTMYTLDIACDSRYPLITREATLSMALLFDAPVRETKVRASNCVHLRLSHPALEYAFPQHGPGRKHERKIELVEWQRVLTHRHPDAFIRGLIHSDGARCINQVNTTLPSGRDAHYEYVRYFFTNYSADIRQIFCEHCELLGIRWTQSNSRNISISHRDSVAILEEIVGPKS